MAQKITTTLIDDIDGGGAAESVTFALDGRAYEIDLSAEHAAELRAAFAPYVAAGRRVGGRARVAGQARSASGPSATVVRDWARGQGLEVSVRGRIPEAVRAAYEAAH